MKIVISGVNLVEAGPLKVFRDAIQCFASHNDTTVICLVHKISLVSDLQKNNVEIIEFPKVKKSWLKRLYFEYSYCFSLSKKLKPDVWVSMHDMSTFLPKNIVQFVYCHNPTIFYTPSVMDIRFGFKTFLFSLFYRFIYRLNIKSNKNVICQQEWFSNALRRKFKLKNVITSRPILSYQDETHPLYQEYNECTGKINIFYPAMPRTFKNHELILKAIEHLSLDKDFELNKFRFIFTFSKLDSTFTEYLWNKYSHLECVDFIGHCSRQEIDAIYKSCQYVIFPSKLETWGLPIQEAKQYNKPLILADLPYAHETLGDYDKVIFINVNDPIQLSNVIRLISNDKVKLGSANYTPSTQVLESWPALTRFIIEKSSS